MIPAETEEAATRAMVEVLHGMSVPWGGRMDGNIWLDANSSHAIAEALAAAGFRRPA